MILFNTLFTSSSLLISPCMEDKEIDEKKNILRC